MKIGVLSDTHDDVQGIRQALRSLESLGASMLIHCGDVGLEIIPFLKGMRTHFVFGNMDNADQLGAAIQEPEHTHHGQFGTLEIEGLRVAFLHGHDEKLLRHTIHSGHWDLVCHGHTHAFSSKVEGRTLVLNPGAISRTGQPSLAVVEMPSLKVTQIQLQGTTG